MWFRPEMSSIFYVESCETIKVTKDEVNDLFMLNDILMRLIATNYIS